MELLGYVLAVALILLMTFAPYWPFIKKES